MSILLLAVLGIVSIVLTVLIVEFAIPWFIIELGKVDSWWSPFKTLPPPGEMYIIVRGASNGPFDTIIESVLSHDYDEITNEFVGPLATLRTRDDYLSNLGVMWVGFFRYLFYREIRHDRWEKLPHPSTQWGLVSKVRPGPSIFFRYNMAVEIKATETKGNFPVDAVIVFTVEIVNPVKAFFFAGGWETQTAAAVTGKFREYVASRTVDELRTEQLAGTSTTTTVGTTPVVDEIKTLGGRGTGAPTGLYALYGVDITDARFVLFDLVSGDRDTAMLNATRALEIARLEAQADKERGIGERDRRIEKAVGVEAEVRAWAVDPVGGQVAMAEAIKEAKPNVIGGGVIASVDSDRRSSP